MDEPTIDEVSGSDVELVATLAAAGLPVDDLAEPGRHFFRFRDHGRLIGFVGWEEAGDGCALLRSLVVVPTERGHGRGRVISAWALLRLAEVGVGDAYVLTNTAEALVLGLGFARVDRAAAPAGIRASRQFAGLCPASAALMHRSLP